MESSGSVAILYKRAPGGDRAHAHSGTTIGLARALADTGRDVLLVDSSLPSWTDVLVRGGNAVFARSSFRLDSRFAPTMRRIRTRRLPRGIPVIAMTSQAGAVEGHPVVTFEDMTVALARRFPFYSDASDAALARHEARQRRLYGQAVACCVGSGWAAESLRVDYDLDPSRIHVVGRGHSFQITDTSRDWRTPRFLFSGRDWHRKNGDRVLRAFQEVRSSIPEAELHLVGSHPPTNAPGVFSHGYLNLGVAADRARMRALYEEATCLVMPSLCEAFGLSYIEAASFGVPAIGTTVGGAADAIGPAGRLVDPSDVSAITAAMTELSEPRTAESLGTLAREQANRFAWPRVASRILDALRGNTVGN